MEISLFVSTYTVPTVPTVPRHAQYVAIYLVPIECSQYTHYRTYTVSIVPTLPAV